MKTGKLSYDEFDKRCREVFDIYADEECYYITVDDDNNVTISMGGIGDKSEQFRWVHFDYEPDMTDSPQALAYLLGETDEFDD